MESWSRGRTELEESYVDVKQIKRFQVLVFVAATCGLLSFQRSANAQLSFVEIMANSVDDTNWEWVEVLNSGATAVDLDGYVIHDMNAALAAPNISKDVSTNTIIPAGGVAVLYNGGNLDYSETRFRNAWGLAPSVPLIGVTSPPRLNNGGDQIGLWASFGDYSSDLGNDEGGGMEVVRFDNAVASLDFDGDFPSPNDESIYWSGTGDNTDAANWFASADGIAGAYGSTPTFFDSAQINSIEDLASPGAVPAGAAADGLLITEIMYNPSSDDDDFEWVEIYNNTGATIDFSATPYFFDDTGGDAFDAPNVAAGTVADDSVAVLYDADGVSEESMKAAWGADINFIGVTDFSALNNGGDGVGLWTNAVGYEADRSDDTFLSAVTFAVYGDGDDEWPTDNGAASIFLTALNSDQQDGANWERSTADDGLSFNAMAAFESMIPDHPGGDIGSPGIGPGQGVPVQAGDFNGDGDLDVNDINNLTEEVRNGTNDATFDLNDDAVVDQADRVIWVEQLKNTYFGDSNLDGEFNTSDFVGVFTQGLYESGVDGDANWEDGDWNGDGNFSSSDFVTAFQADAYEKGPRQINAVPEPNSALPLLIGALGLMLIRRR